MGKRFHYLHRIETEKWLQMKYIYLYVPQMKSAQRGLHIQEKLRAHHFSLDMSLTHRYTVNTYLIHRGPATQMRYINPYHHWFRYWNEKLVSVTKF